MLFWFRIMSFPTLRINSLAPSLMRAKLSNEDVVKIFFEPENVTPDCADTDRRTPLMVVERGHIRVVLTLQGKCNISQDVVVAHLTSLTTATRASKKRHREGVGSCEISLLSLGQGREQLNRPLPVKVSKSYYLHFPFRDPVSQYSAYI